MEDDFFEEEDWVDKPIVHSAEIRTCTKCGRRHRVELRFGPEHGGWNENFNIDCEDCGTPMGEPVRAFGVEVVKLKRRARR